MFEDKNYKLVLNENHVNVPKSILSIKNHFNTFRSESKHGFIKPCQNKFLEICLDLVS